VHAKSIQVKSSQVIAKSAASETLQANSKEAKSSHRQERRLYRQTAESTPSTRSRRAKPNQAKQSKPSPSRAKSTQRLAQASRMYLDGRLVEVVAALGRARARRGSLGPQLRDDIPGGWGPMGPLGGVPWGLWVGSHGASGWGPVRPQGRVPWGLRVGSHGASGWGPMGPLGGVPWGFDLGSHVRVSTRAAHAVVVATAHGDCAHARASHRAIRAVCVWSTVQRQAPPPHAARGSLGPMVWCVCGEYRIRWTAAACRRAGRGS